ncbi:hypothetical protein CBL_21246, partial [Carabus blaptoides fortunei]
EMHRAIKQLKPDKAPGVDLVPNEGLKNLPENWNIILLKLLNNIFEEETIPPPLAKIDLIMSYKKEDPQDPNNYRPIALICTILKLLTQIIAKRLLTWAESFEILPEAQAGFRRSRSCTDQIFTLNSIVQLQTATNNNTYTIFVDFKDAFDSIDHELLWNKLYLTG